MNIPEGVVPLGVGTVLAVAALSVVLAPLLSTADAVEAAPVRSPAGKAGAEGTAVAALREIEFDKATGKLSDTDYESLRATYTRDALAELRRADNGAAAPVYTAGTVTDDVVEAAIQRARDATLGCVVCGPRPELDAVFCSSCGRYLAGHCRNCGAPVDLVGARFCTGCGEGLVAA